MAQEGNKSRIGIRIFTVWLNKFVKQVIMSIFTGASDPKIPKGLVTAPTRAPPVDWTADPTAFRVLEKSPSGSKKDVPAA